MSIPHARAGAGVATAALLLLAGGCGGPPSPDGPGPRTTPRTELEVENLQWEDLTVYLVHEGRYVRLGWVVAQTSELLVIPEPWAHAMESVYLVAAHPSDREPHAFSWSFLIQPEERHRWVILPTPGPSQVIH